jgi:hypothetical protein
MMGTAAFSLCIRWSQMTTCVSASITYEGCSCGPMTNTRCTAPFTPFTVSCRQCKPICNVCACVRARGRPKGGIGVFNPSGPNPLSCLLPWSMRYGCLTERVYV